MVMHNTHQVTDQLRQRVSDMAAAGLPQTLIAEIIGIAHGTLISHYKFELTTGKAQAVARVSKTVVSQAEDGDMKAAALYLKTQGAKFGWVEKQVIEQVEAKEMDELKSKIKELELQYEKDF